jgi:hypothetical protein
LWPPSCDLAIVAIEGEGNAHDLTTPAGELQGIRAPAANRAAIRKRPGAISAKDR